jgi:hypothetical protein
MTVEELLLAAVPDVDNGWSIGTFGAVAEFRRDADEPARHSQRMGWLQCTTARGAIGLHTRQDVVPIAYETLASDGETWGHALALAMPSTSGEPGQRVVRCCGADEQSLQPAAGTGVLFDLGVGGGHVSFCVRTSDPPMIEALRRVENKPLFGPECAAARALLVQASPARIALSPLGRIEVYSRIPGPDERSPSGPHTHLLPKLLASGRLHSANSPIPSGLQTVLSLHPVSPWRDAFGVRTAFNTRADEQFQALLERFGLTEDKAVRMATQAAVTGGADPATCPWPITRRGRIQARITLRRLAQRLGGERLAPWRTRFDRSAGAQDEAAEE